MKTLKFVVALVGAGAIALQTALTDDTVTRAEWVTIGLAVLTAAGVWALPNKPIGTPPAVDGAVRRTYTE